MTWTWERFSFYSFIIIDMDILNAPIIKNIDMLNRLKRLYLLQDPFLEAGISVPDELPYLRFNNLEPPPTIYQSGSRDSKSGERGEHALAIFLPLLC